MKRAAEAAKDPTTYSWLTYLWVVLLSAWGGTLRYLHSIKGKDMPIRKVLLELALGISSSVFVGVVTFYLCEASNIEPLWTAIWVAASGHMGAEGLNILRTVVASKLRSL